MKTRTLLPGVIHIEPQVFRDDRGWLVETFQRDRYRAMGVAVDQELVQDNRSYSVHGALRGLHYRARLPQGKLVSVTRGAVLDVVVDLRKTSPTFKHWTAVELSAANHHQLWIPGGFAHGFLVLSDGAEVQYKVTSNYDAADERTIAWNDPELAIPWPLEGEPILSERDRNGTALREAELPRS